MSDFAKNQMMKHGWMERKGLGKNEDGITKPIKSTIKFDCRGLGYEESSDKSWEKIYNSAVKNIQVESHEDEVSLNIVDDDWEFNLSKFTSVPVKLKKKLGRTQLGYDNFQKSSTLYNGCLAQDDPASSEEGETAQDLVNVSSLIEDHCMIAARSRLCLDYASVQSKSLCMGKLERIALQDSLSSVTRESYENNQPLTFPAICRFASLDLMPTWMIRKEDKDKTNNNIIAFQSLQQTVTVKSKSRNKRYRKKMNNLADQLSACSIKEIDKESKCDSLNDKNSLRKVRKCNRKKESLKIKCKPECLQLMSKHIQSCTTKEERAIEQTRGQDKKEYEPVQQIEKERDNISFSKEESCKLSRKPLMSYEKQPTCLITLKREAPKDGDADKTPSIDIKNNIKNIVYLKKCLKKQKSKRRRRPRIGEIINNIANKSDTNIDTVAKALTKIHLSEDVSTTIKKKPTQTHITPV